MSEKPIRVQLSRKKGWKMPENTVKVDRSSIWGNPFRVGAPPDPRTVQRWGWRFKHPEHYSFDFTQQAVEMFASFVYGDDASQFAVTNALRGKSLACWCQLCDAHKNGKTLDTHCDDCAPCHADVLLEIANAEP